MNTELVLDLHLHSRFSRAVSPRMNLINIYLWGRKKGINLLSVTDFTHPVWFREVLNSLEEIQEGIFRLKNEQHIKDANAQFFQTPFVGPYFLLSSEISCIYTERGKQHRIHNLIFAPNLATVEKINKKLLQMGFNLSSDGRPILGISSQNLADVLFGIERKIAIIPCHVWTPWFSLYGSRSGYDSIVECFGKYAPLIFAVESGLSSDPAMNWRIHELSTRSIVSFSDAHSMQKMGREATVLQPKKLGAKINDSDITYSNILNSFVCGKERVFKIGYTIEFYPEEGKYHYTGHRNCGVSYSPSQTHTKGVFCPVCKRPLTIGVMHRVDDLATESENNFTYHQDSNGVAWVKDPSGKRPPYVSLVPLLEILSEALGAGQQTSTVMTLYDQLVSQFGSEHVVLFRIPLEKLREVAGAAVAEGIVKVRSRDIAIEPGFDGEYGVVKIWKERSLHESLLDKKLQTRLKF